MKKVYLLALTAITSGMAFGQINKQPMPVKGFSTAPTVKSNTLPTKAAGVQVWSSDFDTPADWTIDNDGQAGGQFGWSIDQVSDTWWTNNPPNSNTPGNYAELSNGDAQAGTQALDVVYTMTTTTPIDLTSTGTALTLSFNQWGARFNDLQEWQISTDGGTTFMTVGDNLDKEVLSAGGGSAYANMELVKSNLAPLISGATSLMIRFRWTTNFPTQATNANVWITYGWFIDDVALTTAADNDVSITDQFTGSVGQDALFYTQIPDEQVAPIEFEVEVFNGGSNEAKNAVLSVDVNGGTFTSSSVPQNILPLDTAVLTADAFTPGAIGTYTISRTIATDSIEDEPSDNVLLDRTFDVTDFIYARDISVTDGDQTNNGGFEVGTLYDAFAAQELRGFDVGISSLGGVSDIYINLYQIIDGDFSFLAESNPVAAANVTAGGITTIPLTSPVVLVEGEIYLAVVGSFEDGLAVTNAGFSPDQTSFLFDHNSTTWFYTNNTPIVRMNFDPSLVDDSGLEEGALAGVSLFPVPATTEITLSYDVTASTDVDVTITDVNGKVVYSTVFANEAVAAQSHTIDVSKFNNGMYIVSMNSNNGVVTRKFIKK